MFLPVMWETTRSRSARARWRKLRGRGKVPAGSCPAPRLSHLHLRRFAADDMALCGFGIARAPEALVDLASADLSRVKRCVSCAVLAACEGEHAIARGAVERHPLATQTAKTPVGYVIVCACGEMCVGASRTNDVAAAQRSARRAHREHVTRVVRLAIDVDSEAA